MVRRTRTRPGEEDALARGIDRVARALADASWTRARARPASALLDARAIRLAAGLLGSPTGGAGDPDRADASVATALAALPREASPDALMAAAERLAARRGEPREPPDRRRARPDERRDGGIYYTPAAICRAMVRGLLDPILDEATCRVVGAVAAGDGVAALGAVERVARLRILDPACGSGRFLRAAADRLQAFHRAVRPFFAALVPPGGPTCTGLAASPEALAAASLAGADRDPAACAACQAALSLAGFPGVRVACGDSLVSGDDGPPDAPGAASLRQRLAERVVAIRARGDGRLAARALAAERRALARRLRGFQGSPLCPVGPTPRAIHWGLAFPAEMAAGGFDGVVGNPPYLSVRRLLRAGPDGEASYRLLSRGPRFREQFRSHADLHQFFILRGIELLRPGGRLTFILPSYWLENTWSDRLREEVQRLARVDAVWDLGPRRAFPEADISSLILWLTRTEGGEGAAAPARAARLQGEPGPLAEADLRALAGEGAPGTVRVSTGRLVGRGSAPWFIDVMGSGSPIERIVPDGKRIVPLGEIARIGQGPTCGANRVFRVPGGAAAALGLEPSVLRPSIKCGAVRPFRIEWDGAFTIYAPGIEDIGRYPNVRRYLEEARPALEARRRFEPDRMPFWAWLRPLNLDLFGSCPKIVCPYRAETPTFAMDRRGYMNEGGDVRAIRPHDGVLLDALLAILSSAPVRAWYHAFGKRKGSMVELFTEPLARIPVPLLSAAERAEIGALARAREEAATAADAAVVDRRIDQAVGRAYGMTPGEVRACETPAP